MESSDILIIGAGIAGLSIAYQLSANQSNRSNQSIRLIEQNSYQQHCDQLHPAVVIEPAFVVGDKENRLFNQQAYFEAQKFYQQFQSDIWHSRGLIKLANALHLEKKQTQLIELIESNHPIAAESFFLSKEDLSKLAGINIPQSGIYYPNAGLINPIKITEAIIEKTRSKIDYLFNQSIQEIQQKDNYWIAVTNDEKKLIKSKKIIYAGGYAGLRLLDAIDSTLTKRFSKTRGQISIIDSKKTNYQPKMTLSGKGFISPVLNPSKKIAHSHICFGSSWDRRFNFAKQIKAEDHQQNLIKANSLIDQTLSDLNADESKPINATISETMNASVSVRLNGINREPVVSELRDNFWLFTGFGSRGYQYAPFLSAQLAKKLSV